MQDLGLVNNASVLFYSIEMLLLFYFVIFKKKKNEKKIFLWNDFPLTSIHIYGDTATG